jgi:hypothetical protein
MISTQNRQNICRLDLNFEEHNQLRVNVMNRVANKKNAHL